jgi:PleD family two-component response regulator
MEKSIVNNTTVPVKVTFSAGVANSFENRTVDQICKIADQALYIAKKTRNRVVSQDEIPGDSE